MLAKNAVQLLDLRYKHGNESPEGVLKRVAKAVSIKDDKFEKKLLELFLDGIFLPNSPTIRNAGRKKGLLSACFTGDTIINTTFGDISARELLDKKDFYIFSNDGDRVRLGKANRVVSTGIKEVFKVELDSGKSIKLTADHLILMRDGSYKKVSDLILGDRIMPFNYSYKSGRRNIRERHDWKWKPAYVFVYEEFYGEYNSKIHAIHHNDFNCLNDSPENLILKTWKEHRNFHSELNKGDRNVMKRPEMRKYFSNLMMGNKRALGSIRDAEFRKKLSINNGMKKKEVSERVAEKLRNKPKSQEHIDKLRVAAFLAMQRPDVKKNYIDGMKNRVSLSGEKNGMFGVHRFGENNPNYKHGRYCSNHKVVSVEFCGMEEVFDIETVDEFHNFAAEGIFIHNCFVLPVDDSIHSIFDAIRNMAVIFQRGGGCGFNFSALRPKDAPLSSGGTSSGSTSFMNLFDRVTEIVKQGGFRRGAAMSVLNYNHPDILDFCRSKLTRTLTNFNLSVLVTDEFMASLENGGMYVDLMHEGKKYGSLKSKDIFDLITLGAWVSGDPGLLFYDRINKDNKRFPEIKIIATNPCGEVPLPDWGACTLGSINISKFVDGDNFDFDKFYDIVKIGSRALLNVNLINYYPIPQIGKVMQELSPFGVGIMGFADALIMLGIKYDSEDSLDFIRKLAKPYVEASDEVGGDSFYKRSIAPTGSLSILADCSSGIEPVFDTSFERHITVGVVTETRDIYKSEFCRTAHQVSPDWHIKIQTEFQKFVDAGVSKTVNVPYDIGVEDIRNIYLQAWKRGAKGITVFRDKSIPGVLVSTSKCDGESCIL